MTTEKLPAVTTPLGVLNFPWIRTPDSKYAGEGQVGKYKCGIIVPAKDATELCGVLNALVEQSYVAAVEAAKPQNKSKILRAEPYKVEYDKEGDETGNIIFNAKSNYAPTVTDVDGDVIPENVSPYGGSTGKMTMTPKFYFMESTKSAGVTCYLNSVQIFKLVTASV